MENEIVATQSEKPKNSKTKGRRGIFEKNPGSGVWWIRFVDGSGVYRREKAGTFATATKLLSTRQTEALNRKKLPSNLRNASVLFSEIARDALAWSQKYKLSHRTDMIIGRNLMEWFGSERADSLFGDQIEKKLEAEAKERGWAASTFNHYRSFMMLAYREARRNRKVTNNPARDVRHQKENNKRVRHLGREAGGEYERLTNAIRKAYPEHLPEFIFALSTGLRLGSQYAATYEMIDWQRRELTLPRTKNGEPVTLPLNADAINAIKSVPSYQEKAGAIFRAIRAPYEPVRSNDHWFKPAMRLAGIQGFHWHDLRHTFASWLIQDGVPLERVSKLLGHKSLSMTMRYAHLAPNKLHEDVALLTLKSAVNSTPVAPDAIEPAMSLVN